jgi:hypothetical protein
MPAALDVNREAVRVLCVAVGVREAARRMNLPESTVQAWSARGEWFSAPQPLPKAPATKVQPNTPNPAEELQNTLLERKDQTRLHLSRYVVDASKRAADSLGELDIAPRVREVAQVAGAVWPETRDRDQEGGTLVLAIGGNVNLGEQHLHAPGKLPEKIVCDAFEVKDE